MISLQQMHYILILNEQRQFQRASELCFVTQPTLSMQVKKAEEALGYPIFDRSRNPLELTPFGKHLIPLIREVLNETSKIDLLRKRMVGTYVEQIKIGVIPTIAAYLVPDMFGIWQQKMSGIQLIIEELRTEELLQSMENKALDLAILAGPFSDPSFRTMQLFTEEIKVYTKEVNTPDILMNQLSSSHPWLLSKGNCLRTQMIRFCQLTENNETDHWNYQGGNLDLLLQMVDLHGGYTLVPEHYKISTKQQKHLKRVFSGTNKTIPVREVIALVHNRNAKQTASERIVREVQFKYTRQNASFQTQTLNWNG